MTLTRKALRWVLMSMVLGLLIAPTTTAESKTADSEEVRIWSVADRALLRSLDDASSLTSALVFSPDGSMLAVDSEDGIVRLLTVP